MTKYDEAYRILYSTGEFMAEFLRHCVQEPFRSSRWKTAGIPPILERWWRRWRTG